MGSRGTQQRIRGTTRALVEAARQLRRDLTPAEQALWETLQGRKVAGLRFRCQHAIGPFVADFCCPAAHLIVELDGSIHDRQAAQDAARTDYLAQRGFRVLRFRNDEVQRDLATVLARIEDACRAVPIEQRQRQSSTPALQSPPTSNNSPR